MAGKVSIPNVVGLGIEGIPHGLTVFLQAIQDGVTTIDTNVIYTDRVRAQAPEPTIRTKTAQGNAVSITGYNVASGNDYVLLVNDFDRLLQSHLALLAAFNALVEQLKGRQ
jgi:hypothetical protein